MWIRGAAESHDSMYFFAAVLIHPAQWWEGDPSQPVYVFTFAPYHQYSYDNASNLVQSGGRAGVRYNERRRE